MKNDDHIINQIEGLGLRRLAGCLLKIAAVGLFGGIVLGLVAKHTQDACILAAVVFAVTGLLFGFATAPLAVKPRKFLTLALIAVPLAAALIMFVYRTLLGAAGCYPLRLVVSPLLFSTGYIAGQLAWNIKKL